MFATLVAASAVGGALLVAPDSAAEAEYDFSKKFTCKETAQLKLTKDGKTLEAETSSIKVDDPNESEKCGLADFIGQITDVTFEQKGKMCTAKSSKGSGDADEKKSDGGKGGEDTAKNAEVSITAPLKGGPKQGKFNVKFATDPSSASSESVTAQGTFKAGKDLQLEKCDLASLPDAATVTVTGTAEVVPKSK